MAKLTPSEAARATRTSRKTIYRRIEAGRVTRGPDGRIDTDELVRAGFTLYQTAQPATGQEEGTPAATSNGGVQNSHPLAQVIAVLEREREALLAQLAAAEERERVAREPKPCCYSSWPRGNSHNWGPDHRQTQ